MSAPLRVLVVDDAPAVAALHARFVEAHPECQVVGIAATGPQAVAAIRQLQPDLVLLDVYLPGMTGLEALREIRADGSLVQPEVITVTAARDIETVREARTMGARHYLVKPFTAQELYERVEDVVRDRAALTEGAASLDQRGVDAVMRAAERRPLPKGLSAQTRDVVRAALLRLGTASAAEVAAEAGLSRVSTRRYLEHEADSGLVVRTLDYATAGRPSTRYRMLDAD